MLPSILIRRETQDEQHVGKDVQYMDEIDMVIGSGGKLVVVAIKHGKQVCQRCAHGFDQSDRRLKPVEVTLYPGSPPILLHAKCETADPKVYVRGFDTLRLRRGLAKVAKGSASLVQAAMETGKRIIE